MIFAAGFGTRMGALTRDRPKPLLHLDGMTLLDRAIETGRSAGFQKIAVNAHYQAGMIQEAVADRGIAVSVEAPSILDTGGGLLAARPLLGEGPAATLNPDALYIGPNPLDVLREAWQMTDASALLLLVPPEMAHMREGGGDFGLHGGSRLHRGGRLIYTGAQFIELWALDAFEEKVFSLNACWDRLEAEGRLAGVIYPGEWCDVGTPEALDTAERLLQNTRND